MPHRVFFEGFNCTPLISGATLNYAALIMTKEILTVLNVILSCCHRAEEYRFIKLCDDTEETSKSYESSDNIREIVLVLLYIFALGGMSLNVGTVFSKGLVFLCFAESLPPWPSAYSLHFLRIFSTFLDKLG